MLNTKKARIETKRELERIKSPEKVGREKLEEMSAIPGIDYTSKHNNSVRNPIESEVN
ncbi:MAG: hypothetical protein M3530_01665 [Thermoproteota archaeon]|nr:hypothetical protein [Thermoproteota archaeon]